MGSIAGVSEMLNPVLVSAASETKSMWKLKEGDLNVISPMSPQYLHEGIEKYVYVNTIGGEKFTILF